MLAEGNQNDSGAEVSNESRESSGSELMRSTSRLNYIIALQCPSTSLRIEA